jgi:nicotinamidase-related amidase
VHKQSVEVVQLYSSDENVAVLDALVRTARHNGRESVHLSIESPTNPRQFGSLAIVEEQSLTVKQLQPAITAAERINSKLLLIADANASPPITVLASNLPYRNTWAAAAMPEPAR